MDAQTVIIVMLDLEKKKNNKPLFIYKHTAVWKVQVILDQGGLGEMEQPEQYD